MLSGLADVISDLEIPVCGEAIEHVLKLRDMLDAKISDAVGEYDHHGLAIVEGATSTTGFIKQCGVAQPGLLVKTARRLRDLPIAAQAWQEGRLTGGQVQGICANLTDATAAMFREGEAELIRLLEPLSTFDTAVVMRQWRALAEARLDPDQRDEPRRTAFLAELLDGRGRLDVNLDADAMQLLRTALRLAQSNDAEGETRSAPERRADALVDIMRFYLDHQNHVPKNRNRPHANIIINWDDLISGRGATYTDGTPAAPATVKQTVCDAGVSRVVTNGKSVILDYGTTVYPFSDAQFQALVLRDQHCRHPGCDRPPQWCEAHHVRPWPTGPTSLTNAVLKCSRHHHLGHQPGWTETLEPDGTYHLTAPHGRTWTTTPPGVLTRAA